MITPAMARELQLRASAKAAHLAACDTYLVSEEMRDLSYGAAQSFPSDDFSISELPSRSGFMVVDNGPQGVGYTVVMWVVRTPEDERSPIICVSDPMQAIGSDGEVYGSMYLYRDHQWHWANMSDQTLHQVVEPYQQATITIVRCIWALMQMPYVSTDVRRARRTSIDKRNKTKLRSNAISVIDLRRSARSTTPTPTGRHLAARHYRRGTWNWQPYGPGNSLRRKQYRRPTIVGPDGTPIIVRDKVNYFRR